MQHLAELQQLRALDLVNLDYPANTGPHDLHNILQPLTRLTSLRTLLLHVSLSHFLPPELAPDLLGNAAASSCFQTLLHAAAEMLLAATLH